MQTGWALTLASSAMCLLGCSIVYADLLYSLLLPSLAKSHPFNIAQNKRFLVAALSLSSGSLLYTSLARLLPHAESMMATIDENESSRSSVAVTAACFVSGIAVFAALDALVSAFTSQSIVHCAHDDSSNNNSETTPLVADTMMPYSELQSHEALAALSQSHVSLVGYSSTQDSENMQRVVLVAPGSLVQHQLHEHDHRHRHIETSVSRMLSIGIQTTLAISLHKLPEGFIYYATSKVDEALSVNIFLSLAVHNVAEGLSMAIPLYVSLNSRWKAVCIGGVLGGAAQPLGALLAMIIVPDQDNKAALDTMFGCTMAVVSGFLAIIAAQMLITASGFAEAASHRFVTFWFALGMSIICLSALL